MAEFANTIAALNRGQVETELSIHLKEVVSAVRDTGKSGKITLSVEIAKDKHDERLIRISTDVKVKMPEMTRPASHFYVRDDRLIRLEDAQQVLDFGQGVPEPKVIELAKASD